MLLQVTPLQDLLASYGITLEEFSRSAWIALFAILGLLLFWLVWSFRLYPRAIAASWHTSWAARGEAAPVPEEWVARMDRAVPKDQQMVALAAAGGKGLGRLQMKYGYLVLTGDALILVGRHAVERIGLDRVINMTLREVGYFRRLLLDTADGKKEILCLRDPRDTTQELFYRMQEAVIALRSQS
jgi:hypothetical protein